MDLYSNAYRDNELWQKLMLKNEDAKIEESFNLPDPVLKVLLCKSPVVLEVLTGIVSEEVINMINAGNVSGAIDKVNCDKVGQNNLLDAVASKLKEDLEKRVDILADVRIKEYSHKSIQDAAIEREEGRVAELVHKISCIETRLKAIDMCQICYDEMDNTVLSKCCQNAFCFDCLMPWLSEKGNCPMCRKKLTTDDIVLVKKGSGSDGGKISNAAQAENDDGDAGDGLGGDGAVDEDFVDDEVIPKLERLNKLVSRPGHHKYLIFAGYENSFNNIIKELNKIEKDYDQLKGHWGHIKKLMDRYKKGDLDVILLNSAFFGSGFNLENTTDIILFHRMEPDTEMQAIGRAQRPGRDGPLKVWKLYYQNESTTAAAAAAH